MWGANMNRDFVLNRCFFTGLAGLLFCTSNLNSEKFFFFPKKKQVFCNSNRNVYIWGNKLTFPGGAHKDVQNPQKCHFFSQTEEKWKKIYFGPNFGVALNEKGNIFCWGGVEEQNQSIKFVNPFRVEFDKKIIDVQCSATDLYALTSYGDVFVWENVPQKLQQFLDFSSSSSVDKSSSTLSTSSDSSNSSYTCYSFSLDLFEKSTNEKFFNFNKIMFPRKKNFFGLEKDRKIVFMNVGVKHAAFVSDEGNLYCCGENRYGQCGELPISKNQKKQKDKLQINEVQFNYPSVKIKKVCCGKNHTVALDTDGYAYCFGDDSKIQLALGDTRSNSGGQIGGSWKEQLQKGIIVPNQRAVSYKYYDSHAQHYPVRTLPPVLTIAKTGLDRRISDIQTGDNFTIFIYPSTPEWMDYDFESNVLMCAGDNIYSQCGRNTNKHQQTLDAVKLPLNSYTENISCGSNHCVATLKTSEIFAWGFNSHGQTGVLNAPKGIVNPPKRVILDTSNSSSSSPANSVETTSVQSSSITPKLPRPSENLLSKNVSKILMVSCSFDSSAIIQEES